MALNNLQYGNENVSDGTTQEDQSYNQCTRFGTFLPAAETQVDQLGRERIEHKARSRRDEKYAKEVQSREGHHQETVARLTAEATALLKETQETLQIGCKKDLANIEGKHTNEIHRVEEHSQESIARMQAKVGLLEHQRRKWLNQAQELRGGFRVVCRMRPFLRGEEQEGESSTSRDGGSRDDVAWLHCRLAPASSNAAVLLEVQEADKVYPMDGFIGPSQRTAQVADEIEPLVHSLIWAEGAARVERGVVLACGQTASGKTTCIRALLKRVFALVFEDSGSGSGSGSAIEIACTFVQVYGNEYGDLFVDNKKDKAMTTPLKIDARRTDGFVVGAQVRTAASQDELMALLEEGSARRQTRETVMNKASSRSHGFFTMVFRNKNNSERRILTLVDLAGSEKPSTENESSATEGIEINKSLIALRTSMARLKQASKTNSNSIQSFFSGNNMTELLGYMLGDDARMVRVLVLLTINPSVAHLHQSLSTLEFGVRVASRSVSAKRSDSARAVAKAKTS